MTHLPSMILLAIFGLTSGNVAWAEEKPGCLERIEAVCRGLLGQPPGVVARNEDGTLSIHPLTRTQDWPAEYRPYLELKNVNRTNFETKILPVFRKLKEILVERVAQIPLTAPYRQQLLSRVSALELRVASYERCHRPNRTPFVASYDQASTVLICPVVSHLAPSAVLSVLAHELGHTVDLCDEDLTQVDSRRLRDPRYLIGFPFETLHACSMAAHRADDGSIRIVRDPSQPACSREGEIYADYLSAHLSAEFLRRQAAGQFQLVQFSPNPEQAALEYTFYRIDSACDVDPRYRDYLKPILQSREAQSLLMCQGGIGETACTDEQVASGS
jgi:hypothetical protein